MGLLQENELVWSPIVANTRMNRSRQASGVNSYEKEFKFAPERFLLDRINKNGSCSWLDICCGEGRALKQTFDYLVKLGLADSAVLHGVDILETSSKTNSTGVTIFSESAVSWTPKEHYDLITCSHGLHYIGDKLRVVEKALGSLKSDGELYAHLDLSNIVIERAESSNLLKLKFKESGLGYNQRTKLLTRRGNADISFGLLYQGADDKAGPNYTGQDSITPHYKIT
jgi:trans-aconitate methyltransferase